MKCIKSFLRKVDFFGVSFFFRFKGDRKYRTSLGGLFIIIFIVFVICFSINYLIPFINRENFTIVYYTMSLPFTEQINLKETKSAFAVGFDCKTSLDGTNAEDLLKIQLSFSIQSKNKDGRIIKQKTQLTTHPCTYKDFYNNFNNSLEYLNMDIFQCLDDNSRIVEGIYTDEVFSYYTFTVSIKEDSQKNFDRLNNYLLGNDCKLNVYYTDLTIDINNYKNPVKSYLDSVFIQLDPNYVKKMNAFFLNQHLYNDDYLIGVFNAQNSHKNTKFSRTEDYSIYKGMNRYKSGLYNYQEYAKLYIRADTKKTEIKRKYQKLMEYYADVSSLLIGIFYILRIIFYFINYFYGENSIKKNIFIFKDLEFKHLNIPKKINQIKGLINITDNPRDKKNVFYNEISNDLKENTKNTNYFGRETGRKNMFNNEDMNITTGKKKLLINRNNYDLSKENDNSRFNNDETTNARFIRRRKIKIDYVLKPDEFNDDNNIIVPNIKKNFSNDKTYNKMKITQENPQENVNTEKIEYSLNIFEVIVFLFFKCCLTKKLTLKKNLNDKADKILYQKLDITLYLRNMMLLDIMNKTLLEENMKNIINFISRPILSLNKNENDELESFYQSYTDSEFEKFSNDIYEYAKKSDKNIIEKKILNISNKQLKEFI